MLEMYVQWEVHRTLLCHLTPWLQIFSDSLLEVAEHIRLKYSGRLTYCAIYYTTVTLLYGWNFSRGRGSWNGWHMPVFPIEILCYPADALTRREICCFPAKTWDKYGIISEIPRVFFLVSHLELLVAVLREKIREISKENMTTKNVTDMMILQEITMDFIPENPDLFQLSKHHIMMPWVFPNIPNHFVQTVQKSSNHLRQISGPVLMQ